MLITVTHGGAWGKEAQRTGLRRDTGGLWDLPEFLGASTSWARDRRQANKGPALLEPRLKEEDRCREH